MSAPFGPLSWFTGALLAVIGVTRPSIGALVWAAVCGVVAAVSLLRQARPCGDRIEIGVPPFGTRRIAVGDLQLIEVGKLAQGGFPGYQGYALALETATRRLVVSASLYNGRDRLVEWLEIIERHEAFLGRSHLTDGIIQGNQTLTESPDR